VQPHRRSPNSDVEARVPKSAGTPPWRRQITHRRAFLWHVKVRKKVGPDGLVSSLGQNLFHTCPAFSSSDPRLKRTTQVWRGRRLFIRAVSAQLRPAVDLFLYIKHICCR
jgi:hypothetical protein